MSWSEEYKESEIVEDHTRVLSKIWDNLMPTTYPHVLEFRTNKAVEVIIQPDTHRHTSRNGYKLAQEEAKAIL